MSTPPQSTPSQDDRVMAGLAHITAIIWFIGVIVPIVIWVTQKDKSRYVAFQALQAIIYQMIMIVAWFIGMAVYMVSSFGFVFPMILLSSSNSGPITILFTILGFLIPFAVLGLIIFGGFAFILYAIIAAIMGFQGKPFRYLLIGNWVTRFMTPKPAAAVSG